MEVLKPLNLKTVNWVQKEYTDREKIRSNYAMGGFRKYSFLFELLFFPPESRKYPSKK